MGFPSFFSAAMPEGVPRPYQLALANNSWPETLIIPTGFGKTAAVLAAWLWKIAIGDPATPRRLIYCLPMRVLVEQTEAVAAKWISAAQEKLQLSVELDVLMGGRHEGQRGVPRWILNPESPTVLIGTQDLLVSAALMRGYGASRYRWPVDFALLHNDVLWVFDEVQLAGATLPTSAQLEGFRRKLGTGRQCHTLWMSATLDPAWLETVDFVPADLSRPHDLSAEDLAQAERLWTARKVLRQLNGFSGYDIRTKNGLSSYAHALAQKACELTLKKPGTSTILFLNTVGRAQAVYDALCSFGNGSTPLLIHSRFRSAERTALSKIVGEKPTAADRIVVTTQALEAGVDTTCATMLTEIAPWSSLVQRFGRCNRYGECGKAGADVFWIDLGTGEQEARPYKPSDFDEARKKLASLSECGPADLVGIPPSAPTSTAVIRKRDLLDLFDTEPDLSGFDVDVSLYVRDTEDTDVRLLWRAVDGDAPPADADAPRREELCPAPIGGAKQLVQRNERAWRWDALAKQWRRLRRDDIFPGLTIWVDAASGGYDRERGFDPTAQAMVQAVANQPLGEPEEAVDEDNPSEVRVSLAKHTLHVIDEVKRLSKLLRISDGEQEVSLEAARWHDFGKAHEVFKTRCGLPPDAAPLAKTPDYDWRTKDKRNRPFFRHELASALAYLANHAWSEAESLAAYLIAAHHGKVRMRLRPLPKEPAAERERLFARGIWDGDSLPETDLGGVAVPPTTLDLDIMQLGEGRCGPSWQARSQILLRQYGPFRLAWLEALLRIADWRASEAEEIAGHDDL